MATTPSTLREARQNLRLDAPHRVLHGGRDALHRGGDAQDVLGAGARRPALR